MTIIKKNFVFLFCFAALVSSAQQSVQKIITETQYLLSLPEQYYEDSARRWPLLLFLHGSSESGLDIEKVKTHGPPKLIARGKKFPFINVSPQSDVPSGWDVDQLFNLLQHVKKAYRVDRDRIYLTGLSMGGFGTWALAMKYPEEFAAIAPICGGGDTADAWKLRNTPVWCFHGAQDNVVPLSGSENMVSAAARWNPNIRFTVYPDKNHNSWDTTYDRSDTLYHWLLKQTRHYYKEIPVPLSVLKKYEGSYLGTDGDTVKLTVSQNRLIALPGKDTVPLQAASPTVFFLKPDRNMDIRFVGNERRASSFLFFGDRKLVYRRIKVIRP